MMVGNVEIMVFVLNNSSALHLTPEHIIPTRPRAPCCWGASGCRMLAEPGRERAVLSPFREQNNP